MAGPPSFSLRLEQLENCIGFRLKVPGHDITGVVEKAREPEFRRLLAGRDEAVIDVQTLGDAWLAHFMDSQRTRPCSWLSVR